MTAISAKEMQKRVASIASTSWIKPKVNEMVENDQKALKERKINEFEFGLRPNNKKIGKYESQDYAFRKNMMNGLAGFGNVDLINTKYFSSSLFVLSNSVGYIFDSPADYKDRLVTTYGRDILGLNQKWFNDRQQKVYAPILISDISKVLNKK